AICPMPMAPLTLQTRTPAQTPMTPRTSRRSRLMASRRTPSRTPRTPRRISPTTTPSHRPTRCLPTRCPELGLRCSIVRLTLPYLALTHRHAVDEREDLGGVHHCGPTSLLGAIFADEHQQVP